MNGPATMRTLAEALLRMAAVSSAPENRSQLLASAAELQQKARQIELVAAVAAMQRRHAANVMVGII